MVRRQRTREQSAGPSFPCLAAPAAGACADGEFPSIRLENFAYPYGLASIWRKPQLADQFRSARGILPGVNRGVIDLHFLRASPLIDRDIDNAGVDRALDEAEESGGWLIFYGHDVADRPSPYGCSPARLRHALKAAQRRNMPIVTIADTLQRIGA